MPREVRIAIGILAARLVWTFCAYVLPHLPVPTSKGCYYYDAEWDRGDVSCADLYPSLRGAAAALF